MAQEAAVTVAVTMNQFRKVEAYRTNSMHARAEFYGKQRFTYIGSIKGGHFLPVDSFANSTTWFSITKHYQSQILSSALFTHPTPSYSSDLLLISSK